jgi:hypothetical protein
MLICYSQRFSFLGLKAVEIPDELSGNAALGGLPGLFAFALLRLNPGELAGVEPVTGAVRTLIHFNAAFGGEEMAVELYAGAPGAVAFAERVHGHAFVALDPKEGIAGSHLLIRALQFEGVKPDPAAAALADVHAQAADLNLGQYITARRAFHDLA